MSDTLKALTTEQVAEIRRDAMAVTWTHEPSDVVRKAGSNVTLAGVHGLCDSVDALRAEIARLTTENTALRKRTHKHCSSCIGGESCWGVSVPKDLSIEFAAIEAALAAVTQELDEYKALAAVGRWHDDCRPNRHQAAQELIKSQQTIDKMADAVTAATQRAETAEARLRDLEAGQTWQLKDKLEAAATEWESRSPRLAGLLDEARAEFDALTRELNECADESCMERGAKLEAEASLAAARAEAEAWRQRGQTLEKMILRLRGALDLCAVEDEGWSDIECADAYEASRRLVPNPLPVEALPPAPGAEP